MIVAWVAVGGMLGAWSRYRVAGWVVKRASAGFPWGTLAVNASGSFALGMAMAVLGEGGTGSMHALVTVGFLGGFTTFSTFAFDAVNLAATSGGARMSLYIAASVGLGLIAIATGLTLGSACCG